jgi:aspartate/methionine/tyrosine aminotransferase
MQLPPFLLDQWLEQKFHADPPIEFDLGSSTGPVWTLRELLALEDGGIDDRLADIALSYTNPAGTPELREEIARMYGVEPEHVQVVTGGAEGLLLLFYLAAEPGANVVLPEPAFPTNITLAESLGIEIRRYTLRAENRFRVDLDEVRRQIDSRTRFVLVNSPHNPTGAVLSDSEMEALHDECAARGVGFVSDEVYHPIYHGPESRSAARLERAIVLGDMSKALCLSGLRTGWLIDRDPRRRAQYTNARSYFTVSNTVLGERLAALAIRQREAIYGRARRIAQSNLALLDRFFAEFDRTLHWVRPSGGMTAFPSLTDGSDGREFCRRIARHGVLLAPGDCFGMPAHFRIGFAASGERFALGLDRLSTAIGQWGPASRPVLRAEGAPGV